MNNLPEDQLRSHLRRSLGEDSVFEDVTTRALPRPHRPVNAAFLSREPGVLAARTMVDLTFEMLAEAPEFPDEVPSVHWQVEDGDSVEAGETLARIEGPASTVLSGERIALNYLQQLSGVASLTHRLVQAASPHGVDVYDTRKTVPHLRRLQKYAVRCGGGKNHRMNLSEAVMVKDNHKALAGGLKPYLDDLETDRPVIVEIHDETELETVTSGLADGCYNFDIEVLMLDNFSPEMIQRASDRLPESVQTEVSGGIGAENILEYCKAGPDRVSVGALTHSFDSLDISLKFSSHLTS